MSRLKDLQEQRNGLAAKMTEELKKQAAADATAETRSASQAEWNKLDAAQEQIAVEIRAIQKQDALDAELRSTREMAAIDPAAAAAAAAAANAGKLVTDEQYRASFFAHMRDMSGSKAHLAAMGRKGINRFRVNDEQKRWLQEYRSTDSNAQAAGTQSLSYTELTSGGAFVPAGFVYDVDIATKYYCPFLDNNVCRVLETSTGNLLPYPTANDTAEQAGILAENTSDTEQPITVGVVNFGAYKFSTRIIRVSLELLQDSAFDFEGFIKQQFAIRLGRAYEQYFTTGTGSAQPTGIATAVLASGATPVVATGSSSNDGVGTSSGTVGTNDLIALEHSVDPTYRRGAKFILHDKSLQKLKQLLDKYGRPLWVPGLASNAPDTILGYNYVIDQQLNQIGTAGAGAVVLFGDLQKFIIRKVKDLQILRLDERYAEYGQVGFIGFARVDSNLVDAGTHPINSLSQHS